VRPRGLDLPTVSGEEIWFNPGDERIYLLLTWWESSMPRPINNYFY